jgi:hypothetical protein
MFPFVAGRQVDTTVPFVHLSDTPLVERISKVATLASVAGIVLIQLAAHPDLTLTLRLLAVAAIAVGWLGARGTWSAALLLMSAPLAPAVLHLLTGREGPVLDVVWMAGLAAVLVGSADWRRWHLPGSWNVLLGGWTLLLALTWPVLLAREIGFDPWVLKDTATWTTTTLSAPRVVQWMLYVVLAQLMAVLWLEWVLRRLAERPAAIPGAAHGLWIGTTLASLVAIVQGSVDPGLLSSPFWASLGRATGTMLDGNAYAMAAAIAGPVGFVALHRIGLRHATLLGTIVLAINVAGMWASASRLALVCGVAGLLALARAHWPSAAPAGSRRPARHSRS